MSQIKNNEITHTGNSGTSNIVLGSSGQVTIAGDLTPSKLKFGSDAAGDIAYYNGTGYARLAPAGASKTLKMNSSNNAPEWVTATSGYTKLVDKASVGTGTSYDVTSIPAGVTNLIILHHGTSFGANDEHCLRVGKSAGLVTSTDYFSSENYADNSISTNSNNNRSSGYATGSSGRAFSGIIELWHLGSNTWQLSWHSTTSQLTGHNTAQIYNTCGFVAVGGTLDRFSYYGHAGASLDSGEISVYYI